MICLSNESYLVARLPFLTPLYWTSTDRRPWISARPSKSKLRIRVKTTSLILISSHISKTSLWRLSGSGMQCETIADRRSFQMHHWSSIRPLPVLPACYPQHQEHRSVRKQLPTLNPRGRLPVSSYQLFCVPHKIYRAGSVQSPRAAIRPTTSLIFHEEKVRSCQ